MNIDKLAASYEYIDAMGEEFALGFYGRLFTQYHETYLLFTGRNVDMAKQRKLLMATVGAVIKGIKNNSPETLNTVLQLGKRHENYGAIEIHYEIVIKIFIDTLRDIMKEAWNPPLEEDWKEALKLISDTMLSAYKKAA